MESGHAILFALLCVSGVFLPAEPLYPTTGQYWKKTFLHICYRTVVEKGSSGYFGPWLLCPYMDSTLAYLHGVGISAHSHSMVAFSLPLPFLSLKVVLGIKPRVLHAGQALSHRMTSLFSFLFLPAHAASVGHTVFSPELEMQLRLWRTHHTCLSAFISPSPTALTCPQCCPPSH